MSEEDPNQSQGKQPKILHWDPRSHPTVPLSTSTESESLPQPATPRSPRSIQLLLIVVAAILIAVTGIFYIILQPSPEATPSTTDSTISSKSSTESDSADGAAVIETASSAILLSRDELLRRGNQALSIGDKTAALEAFQSLLVQDPEDAEARRQLGRAESIDRVYALLEEARSLENTGDLDAAARKYAEAFTLDPLSPQAQQGKSRTERTLDEQQLGRLITEAREAELQGDWATVAEAYQQALERFPGRPNLEKGLQEAERHLEKKGVSSLLQEAYALENQWQWEAARETYLEILKVVPEHTEAKEGLLRTGNMLRTFLRYEQFIGQAQVAADQGRYPEAISKFNKAMGVKPASLTLTSTVKKLKDLLDQQSEPVSLTIESDGKTWVSIVGFELIGKLRSKEIEILPGVYQVRGTRRNYEDVTFELRVKNGENYGPVSVICSKKEK